MKLHQRVLRLIEFLNSPLLISQSGTNQPDLCVRRRSREEAGPLLQGRLNAVPTAPPLARHWAGLAAREMLLSLMPCEELSASNLHKQLDSLLAIRSIAPAADEDEVYGAGARSACKWWIFPTQCWFNAGLTPQMLAWHWTDTGRTSHVFSTLLYCQLPRRGRYAASHFGTAQNSCKWIINPCSSDEVRGVYWSEMTKITI